MAGHKPKRTTTSASRFLSSSPKDPNSCPFEDFLKYLNSSLGRNVFLRLSEGVTRKMKATLANLRQNDQRVALDIVERIVTAIDAFQEACSQLHPSAFVAIVRILIHAGNSQLRDRGLYLLAMFLRNANRKQEATHEIQKSLSDIGKDCLELVFVTFCDKSEPYETRRWAGFLILELTSDSDDNVGLIGFMPEDKRRKLGSQILYEGNEILRSISGRILTTLVDSGIEKESFFPNQTEEEFIAQYPGQAPSASQWDKKFSNYLDDIWDKIAGPANNGTVDFAQNLVTIPEYLNTKSISIYHRSIYVVLLDCVYIYIHPGNADFSHTAIDIPLHLVSDIHVERTSLDQSIGAEPPADLVFHITNTEGDQVCVNSSPSELSVVRLTFRNMAEATDIGNAVQHCKAKLTNDTGGKNSSEYAKQVNFSKVSQSDERLVVGGNNKGTNAKAAKKTDSIKASQSEEGVVLDGKYQYANAKTGEFRVNSDIRATDHAIESSFHESFDDSFVGVVMAPKSSPVTSGVKTLHARKVQNTTDDDGGLYDASPIAHGRRPRSLIAAAPVNSSLKQVPPIPNAESGIEKQIEGGGARKTTKRLRNAPTDVTAMTEDNEVSGMSINTSDEFGISSPHIHQSLSMALSGNLKDDALLPTQHDESIDELIEMPFANTRAKTKQSLKSKKPLRLSKKADGNGNTASRLAQQQDKTSKHDVIEETQDVGDKDTALEKVPKHESEKVEENWGVKADSPKLPSLPSKQPAATAKGASKKRKSELDALDRSRPGNRRNALPAKDTASDFADGTHGKRDVKHGPSNRSNKQSSTTLAKKEQGDGKENPVAASAVVTKSKKTQKKPLLKAKAALKVKESVPNDIDTTHADTGGQHEESDTLDPLQRNETFFEEAFHDYELPNVEDEPSFTPVPPVSAVTKMASKMEDMFGFVGGSAERQRMRIYGKAAQRAIRAPQKQTIAKAKVGVKGRENEEVDSLPEEDSLPEQLEQKRSPITTEKSPAIMFGEEDEVICISSDEESEDPGDIGPQVIAQAAMIKPDKKTTMAAAAKTESSIPVLLEAPSELSSEDLSTPAMTHIPQPTVSPAVDPTKPRNVIDAAHLVDDHLSRKTPIVAFGRRGPKNRGAYSALKPKPVVHRGPEMDVAKLVNAVALGPPKKRPSPEPTPYFERPIPKRFKKVENAAETAADDDTCNDDIPNMLPHQLKPSSPFSPPHDSLLCSSQSRVDENGSPRARTMIIDETINLAQARRRTLSFPKMMSHISQAKAITTERGPFNDPDDDIRAAFDDEPTMVQNFEDPSPEWKPQLLGREKEATVKPLYLLSGPSTAGKNVVPETDHASTVNSVNPFERQPRKLSNFSKRLKGDQPVGPKIIRPAEPQPQPPLTAANGQPRKRPVAFEREVTVLDPEKTLVDAENQYPWRRARSVSLGSSASSDTVDSKASVAASEEQELTPEMAWRKTLQSPYRNLTDTLICMVNTLVGNLVDKEKAIDDIVDDYTRNGTKQVEEFERKTSADRRELESQFSNTLQKVTRSFQETKDATIALNSEWGNLDEVEAQWRKRQHELQDFMNEKIKRVRDGTWKD